MRHKKTAPKLEIQRYFVVNISHINPRDMKRLKKGSDTSLIFNEFEYGVSIYTGDKKDPAWKIAEDEVFSFGAQTMLKLALDNNCRYLKLDRDGPVVEGYAVYDW